MRFVAILDFSVFGVKKTSKTSKFEMTD